MRSLVSALAGLLLGAALGAAQDAPPDAAPVSEAVQSELAVVQDLLTRAITEFEGVQQSRSIVLLDDVVSRLGAKPASVAFFGALKNATSAAASIVIPTTHAAEMDGSFVNRMDREREAAAEQRQVRVRP